MNLFINCLLVGAGGMIGTICRYLFGLLPFKMQSSLPINTLLINIIGALCVGIIIAFLEENGSPNPQLLLFLKIGICGGFTTFSAFSLEAMQLLQNGKFFVGLLYVALSIVLCLIAVFGGQAMVK